MLDLNALLEYATEHGATDIHISVGISPQMRVHGRLVPTNFPKMTAGDTLAVFLSFVNPQQRDRFEEKGEIDISVSSQSRNRYRVNAYKQRGSITLAIRLMGKEIPSPEFLAIPQSVLDICEQKKGLVIVSGPSGSGKSALLASLIDRINNTRRANIITIEDPIEYLHQHKNSIVNQREIGLDTESYKSALSAALKEDPDVIQIGALPNAEIAMSTFSAAAAGRLIFTTMHTVGIYDTLESIQGLFASYQQEQARIAMASSLNAIVSRQLCETKDGSGRIAAYGVMKMNRNIRLAIRKGDFESVMDIVRDNQAKGMMSIDDSLYELFKKDLITERTAISQSGDPELMMEKIERGIINDIAGQ